MNDPEQASNGSGDTFPLPSGTRPADTAGPEHGFSEAAAAFQHAPLMPQVRPAMASARRRIERPLVTPAQPVWRSRDRRLKRCVDLILGAILLTIFALPMAVIAVLLLAEGGSVLFVQRRVGRSRQRFGCLKFRTMRRDAEARLAAVLAADPAAARAWDLHQKLDEDPRITRLGRWLRASSLDELPQLINVLRGEMSLVGPRPIVAPEVPGYPSDRAYFDGPFFGEYAGCLPGMTGLWQISGRHGTLHSERIRLDRVYARTWTIGMDLKILWRTVGVVLSRTGR